jgi:hypothetical protein
MRKSSMEMNARLADFDDRLPNPLILANPIREENGGIEFEQMADFTDGVSKILGIENSVWSNDDCTDFTAIPFPDARILEYDGGWGKACEKRFTQTTGPTWAQIWKAADELIKESDDLHHIYIESVELNKDGHIEFSCGS